MTNPTAAMLVIGDEILSGRTRDANMYHLANELTKVGIDLKEVRVVSDDKDAIIAAIRSLKQRFDTVFTSGGIGPTHDDITADCVAQAFDVAIDVRKDAYDLMDAHYKAQGSEFTETRMRMARIPDTATLIENPVSIAPGFTIENVHVMAGVPKIFEAMVASVLPTVSGGEPLISQTYRIERGEGIVAEPLRDLAEKYSDLSLGSYPFQKNGAFGTNIVIRGTDEARVSAAIQDLTAQFPNNGVE
ncbi:molybdenum cofactor synthesis domain-containing protein [Pacificibacter maritimus]|uniref:Molybdenum cofactor synthesis domain-containing protein n=1 Tax=Pacificibacter maritimus TaxID=762213 RepID=A0A3N4TXB9_9RHOB|nr:molybdopterin-binding protein [Pacificibacter maritimus]RPE63156.1 molybdenum cofactor synthesis domain-containing protein [Pacificibacter maritimus]